MSVHGASSANQTRGWVIGKYVLFQIPGLVLLGLGLAGAVRWLDLPRPFAYGILALWLVKDVVMFPLVRVAYERASPGGADALLGATAIASERLDPGGYVRIGAERWRAEVAPGHAAVPSGSAVRVRRVEGLLLVVDPE